jgi:hypothetical protein
MTIRIKKLTRATVQLNQPSQLPFLDKLAMSCIYDIIAVTPEDNATWLALVAQVFSSYFFLERLVLFF